MSQTLHILTRTHSDYDEHNTEIVGVTDQWRTAHAFLQIGAFDDYWSHEVEIVTLNVMQDFPDVIKRIGEWLNPATNPLCECGHRLMHHRRKNHAGSCKHNKSYSAKIQEVEGGPILDSPPHKCKGFKASVANPPATDKEK